jgi:phosphonate transport system substrate-binding protein
MKISKFLKSVLSAAMIGALALSMVACSSETQSTSNPATNQSAEQPVNEPAEQPASQPADQAVDQAKDSSYPDKITIVWYPNESAADYQPARDEFTKLMKQATGKEVDNKLTTDYAIAIEALAGGTAQICFMGAQGYIEANTRSADVKPLFVNSGESGTLDDAIYYSWFAVNKGQESNYMTNGEYSIDNVSGKRMSFVSNSSTSGFKVPTNAIITLFSKQDKWKSITADNLIEGGKDQFFSEVLFGGSHQGSAVNLLTGKADVAAFCDTELAPYMNLVSGEENKAGAVYEVKSDASAPFDTMKGKQCVVIKSTPVLNGPFAYNAKTLSPDDVKNIQDLFTSSEVTNNAQIFVKKDSGLVGMFKKTDKECFVLVEDAWFNPIREMK